MSRSYTERSRSYPGRSAHDAVYRVRDFIRQGYRVAVDADLSKFFDTVDHDVLMYRVARKIQDKRLLRLVGKYLRGWMGYYGISEYYRPISEVDHWLRRRLRMCYVKRWRWCRTKVRELVKLGTNLRVAISLGLSRKGPWRLSRTLATQTGMTNKWLKDQGCPQFHNIVYNIP
jgi:hypothetical protein